MIEEVKLKKEKKEINKYTPIFNKQYITLHFTIFRIVILLFFIIGFVLGALSQ